MGAKPAMRYLRLLSLGWSLLALACASSNSKAIGTTELPVAPQGEPPPPEPDPREHPHAKRPKVRRDAVRRVRADFHGVRVRDGEALAPEAFLDEIADADVICVGEHHDSLHDHWAQLRILRGLLQRGPASGRAVGVGLEMVQRPFQKELTRYVQRDLRERDFLKAVEWEQRWGYAFNFYRPLLQHVGRGGGEALALNAPRELTSKVARVGLRGLDDKERESLPDLDLGDKQHRELFDAAMRHHPVPTSNLRRYYAAQVIWDETMADTAANWVVERQPARQLLIAAGSAHCREPAIPRRVRRRLQDVRAISVRPLVEGGEPSLAQTLETGSFDYVFYMSPES